MVAAPLRGGASVSPSALPVGADRWSAHLICRQQQPASGRLYQSACMPSTALIQNDIVVFGLIAATLGAVFWTASREQPVETLLHLRAGAAAT